MRGRFPNFGGLQNLLDELEDAYRLDSLRQAQLSHDSPSDGRESDPVSSSLSLALFKLGFASHLPEPLPFEDLEMEHTPRRSAD